MQNFDESPGQDSFLDIVANLVGILIILVVVVGAQAANVWKNRPVPEPHVAQVDELVAQWQSRKDQARNVQSENKELNEKLNYQSEINRQLSINRHSLLVEIETRQRLLNAQQQKLGQEESERSDLQIKIDKLQNEIELVKYEFTAADQLARPTVEKIAHYPTPIAKTVFADEIHFQIKNQRVAYVPMSELVSAMKAEWKIKAAKLQQSSSISETVGPIDGFRLQYLLEKIPANTGAGSQYGVEFRGFSLQPSRALESETVEEALEIGSFFNSRLRNMRPSKTTISFWVYPDSYDELLELRQAMRKKGFQTAGWPMEQNQSISGSPQGFRTSTN